jgi:phosphonoacetate hydrolase
MLETGTSLKVSAVIPSLTNPNNVSIVTGAPPAVHGIPGNYFWDREHDREVLMNSPAYLRAETILSTFSLAGFRVAAVTAKDKLRRLLGHKLRGICFSAEYAEKATLPENGIDNLLDFVGLPQPSIYSEAVSVFVLQAGARLLETFRPDLLYLSTTDYIQHKFAPGTTEANRLFAAFDPLLQRMDALGATIVLTADHGMNPKTGDDGKPRCIYLLPILERILGPGSARVILPITDPYVSHHGSLGSFASVHLAEPFRNDQVRLAGLIRELSGLRGMSLVLDNREACIKFSLPPDRVGDLVLLADGGTVLGKDEKSHDLSLLDKPLRSHGGESESRVPLVSNRVLSPLSGIRHNYDAFFAALNCAAD